MISRINFLESMISDLDHIEYNDSREAYVISIINELFELIKEE